MALNPLLLRRETRKPLLLTLYRLCLKRTHSLKDPLVQRFWWLSLVHSFKRGQGETDVASIEGLLAEGREAERTLEKAGMELERGELGTSNLRFVTRAAYGQVVFTPRHDAFVQAGYVQTLRMGKRKQSPFPMGGAMVQVHGAGNAPSSSIARSIAHSRSHLLLNTALMGQSHIRGDPS